MSNTSLPKRNVKKAGRTARSIGNSAGSATGGRSRSAASGSTSPSAVTSPDQRDAEFARQVSLVARSDIHRRLFDQFVSALEESAPNSDEAAARRCIAERFALLSADAIFRDSAIPACVPADVTEGWSTLRARSQKYKARLLNSKEFKSVREASKVLRINEDLVRRRINSKALFALQDEGRGAFRMPVWALHKGLGPGVTRQLLETAATSGMDLWSFYLFMTSAQGNLGGLRPVDLLVSNASRHWLAELREGVDVPEGAAPKDAVLALLCSSLVDEMRR